MDWYIVGAVVLMLAVIVGVGIWIGRKPPSPNKWVPAEKRPEPKPTPAPAPANTATTTKSDKEPGDIIRDQFGR